MTPSGPLQMGAVCSTDPRQLSDRQPIDNSSAAETGRHLHKFVIVSYCLANISCIVLQRMLGAMIVTGLPLLATWSGSNPRSAQVAAIASFIGIATSCRRNPRPINAQSRRESRHRRRAGARMTGMPLPPAAIMTATSLYSAAESIRDNFDLSGHHKLVHCMLAKNEGI